MGVRAKVGVRTRVEGQRECAPNTKLPEVRSVRARVRVRLGSGLRVRVRVGFGARVRFRVGLGLGRNTWFPQR